MHQSNTTKEVSVRGQKTAVRLELPPGAIFVGGISLQIKGSDRKMQVPRLYYGKGAAGQSGALFIASLASKQANDRRSFFEVNAGPGEKIYFAMPKRYGIPSVFIDNMNGFFLSPSTASIADPDTGYTEDYYLFESVSANIGQVRVFTE